MERCSTYLIALQDSLLGPTSATPLQCRLPIVIFALPRKNPYLKPVIGNRVRFLIFPISVNQSSTGGDASQLQDCSWADC